MYTEKEKIALQKLGEAWNAFVNILEPEQRNPHKRDSHRVGVAIVDDDVHDFRKAVHDAERIVQARAMRRVGSNGIEQNIKDAVKTYNPKAENIKCKIEYTESNVEVDEKEIVFKEKQNGGYAVMGVTSKSKKSNADDEDDDDLFHSLE